MSKCKVSCLAMFALLLLLPVQAGCASGKVVVEFLFWDPSTDSRYCATCQTWILLYQDFLEKNGTVSRLEADYGQNVFFRWVNVTGQGGGYNRTLLESYNVSSPNSLIIDGKVRVEGSFNETYIREVIDAAVEGNSYYSPSVDQTPLVVLAFSFGFFETFSPCLIIMLSFVLGYTLSDDNLKFRKGFIKVMVFGIGFVLASAILGLAFGLIFFSMSRLHFSITLIVCAFAILFGLNMLGLLKFPVQTKPILSKMAKKYVIGYVGIFLLGFTFYFLDPCIAPVFISMTTILYTDMRMLFLALLIFCIGALIPFFGIGAFAGSISRLSRKAYMHRFLIRGLSGVILISYALYLIIQLLLL